jgi:phosphomannomutase / phosphoglucomutase
MWKTGHSLIKAKMRETGAELAGEMSGHFFFKERWYGFDDGIYAAARLLEILAARSEPPAEVLSALPDGVSTPEIKVDAPGGDPHAFVERFRAKARFEGARLSTIDGLRVDWNDGWGLVRASNTTPVLVLRFDGDDAAALRRIQATFREQLLAVQPDLQLPF